MKEKKIDVGGIQLTESQKREYLKSKIEKYKELVKIAEKESGMGTIAILQAGARGIIPVLAIAPLREVAEENKEDKEEDKKDEPEQIKKSA